MDIDQYYFFFTSVLTAPSVRSKVEIFLAGSHPAEKMTEANIAVTLHKTTTAIIKPSPQLTHFYKREENAIYLAHFYS